MRVIWSRSVVNVNDTAWRMKISLTSYDGGANVRIDFENPSTGAERSRIYSAAIGNISITDYVNLKCSYDSGPERN